MPVTGPRQLTPAGQTQALRDLTQLRNCDQWLIGDAPGLDAIDVQVGQGKGLDVTMYQVNGQLPHRARYAERSTRMVRALAQMGGTLHAWPNKPAPTGLQPSRNWPKGAQGSGTWGTIALAVGLGLRVELHPLTDAPMPDWVEQRQLTLV